MGALSTSAFCLYCDAGDIGADLPKERNAFIGLLAAVHLADKAILNLDLAGVRFLVQLMDHNAVNKFMDVLIG